MLIFFFFKKDCLPFSSNTLQNSYSAKVIYQVQHQECHKCSPLLFSDLNKTSFIIPEKKSGR